MVMRHFEPITRAFGITKAPEDVDTLLPVKKAEIYGSDLKIQNIARIVFKSICAAMCMVGFIALTSVNVLPISFTVLAPIIITAFCIAGLTGGLWALMNKKREQSNKLFLQAVTDELIKQRGVVHENSPLKTILTKYGPQIESLTIDPSKFFGKEDFLFKWEHYEVANLVESIGKYFPKLKHLSLTELYGINENCLAHIKNLPLESLDLGSTDVTNRALAELKEIKELKNLKLSSCWDITSKGLEQLQNCPLETLDLRECPLSFNEFNAEAAAIALQNEKDVIKQQLKESFIHGTDGLLVNKFKKFSLEANKNHVNKALAEKKEMLKKRKLDSREIAEVEEKINTDNFYNNLENFLRKKADKLFYRKRSWIIERALKIKGIKAFQLNFLKKLNKLKTLGIDYLTDDAIRALNDGKRLEQLHVSYSPHLTGESFNELKNNHLTSFQLGTVPNLSLDGFKKITESTEIRSISFDFSMQSYNSNDLTTYKEQLEKYFVRTEKKYNDSKKIHKGWKRTSWPL